MTNGILVYIEHVDGKINRASYEAVRAAQLIGAQTGQEISAVVFGQGVGAIAAEVATKKLKTVYAVESDWLKNYTADGHTHAFRQVVEQTRPALALMTHTYEVRDFAPKLAASMKRMLLGDSIGYKVEDGKVVFTRQIFQGKLAADVVPVGDAPHFASFQIGAFRGDECEAGQAAVQALTVNLDADLIRQQPEERFKEAKAAVDLTQAPLIVSVGRGIKEEKNIEIVKKLASALGAELAASRPICDNEWLPMDRQIGSSGQTVAPKLYLAVGISGAIQHIVGMKGARTIVAINKDAEAPIFEIADYGVVGDLFEIVPALTAEAEKMKH
ncbi:MAG TPA: electron transfer flavoprotein subunit alpha/FixB family protein [Blastocatellia bacterium]|nr:electron transfer flavoprotein subunit alpha/FixB family protein [Blastocatellia bacterium]